MPEKTEQTATSAITAGGLYLEPPELGGSLRTCFQIDEVLEDVRSPYQRVQVVRAGELGPMLLLDGVPQTCLFDEAAYHEMLVHVPMLTHPEPQNVLVVGGGDGGAVREVLKHPEVRDVVLCEIDQAVVELSRRHLPELAASLDDPRVTVRHQDAALFLRQKQNDLDVIIIDSSDPIGPAAELFGRPFYEDVRQALRPGGVAAAQMESFFLYEELIGQVMGFLDEMFDNAAYYLTNVPTYASGVMGMAVCSLGPDPLQSPDPARAVALGPLDYYTPALHRAAFALPQRALRLMPPAVAQRQAARP